VANIGGRRHCEIGLVEAAGELRQTVEEVDLVEPAQTAVGKTGLAEYAYRVCLVLVRLVGNCDNAEVTSVAAGPVACSLIDESA
jgi:hypothetical protein